MAGLSRESAGVRLTSANGIRAARRGGVSDWIRDGGSGLLARCALAALTEPAALRSGLVVDELLGGATGLADTGRASRSGGRQHPVVNALLGLCLLLCHLLLRSCAVGMHRFPPRSARKIIALGSALEVRAD